MFIYLRLGPAFVGGRDMEISSSHSVFSAVPVPDWAGRAPKPYPTLKVECADSIPMMPLLCFYIFPGKSKQDHSLNYLVVYLLSFAKAFVNSFLFNTILSFSSSSLSS